MSYDVSHCRYCGRPRRTGYQKFCSRACQYAYQQEHIAERFWKHVDKSSGADGCWPWLACTINKGYGAFNVAGQLTLAHRFAYELTYGPITANLWVLHRCDTPGCVNPAHLFLGTVADNNADMITKGRYIGFKNWMQTHPKMQRGEQNPTAKLTSLQVSDIFQRSRSGESRGAIAHDYEVSRSTVGDIVKGRTWRHITRIL